MSLIFKPIGILSGLAAGILAKKVFALLWGLIDDQAAPSRSQGVADVPFQTVVASAAIRHVVPLQVRLAVGCSADARRGG